VRFHCGIYKISYIKYFILEFTPCIILLHWNSPPIYGIISTGPKCIITFIQSSFLWRETPLPELFVGLCISVFNLLSDYHKWLTAVHLNLNAPKNYLRRHLDPTPEILIKLTKVGNKNSHFQVLLRWRWCRWFLEIYIKKQFLKSLEI
jgi:hypothetical protein